jgi:hypothetical protein
MSHITQLLLAGLTALIAAGILVIGVGVAGAFVAWLNKPGSEMDGY